jgi:hypothetical protein
MKRWMWLAALVLLCSAGCAPALKDLKPTLSDAGSGNVWFATPGSLIRSSDGTQFVPGPPVMISGELKRHG